MKRLLHIGFTLIMLMAFMASSPALLQLSFAARGDDSSEVGNSNNDNSQSSYLSQNNACRSLYGSGFYYAPKQNACLPPSGSWSNTDSLNKQCQSQFGDGFYYDAKENACMPPSGSWSNPGVDYLTKQCQSQFGVGCYYAPKQNACLPPSGSGSRSSGTEDSDGSKAG